MATAVSTSGARVGLVSAWASRLGGGVFEALVAHTEMVRALGHEPVVFALEDQWSAADRDRFGDTEVVTCPVLGPAMPGWAPALIRRMVAARLDLLHLHGIWLYPSHAAARWAAITGRPYMISPHGMLDPWITGRGRLKKRIARLGYERASWRRAAAFHALTGAEAADIAAETGRADATRVIPNAVAPARAGAGARDGRSVIYIGRIHPKKNLHALVDGWEAAADVLQPHGARLSIAGWGDDADVAALEARLARHHGDDIAFLGPVYGERKAALLAGAHVLALPSHSEGLPVAILEAWAAGTPTLMTTHCHLPQGFERGAAIDCGTSPDTIAAALRRAVAAPPDEWQRWSAAASALAAEQFSPARVQQDWAQAYGELLGRNGSDPAAGGRP